MGKDLPDYEEIPVPLDMPEAVYSSYEKIEHELRMVLKTDRKAAQKILSAYLNLLTVYPDQPYDQPAIIHPIEGRSLQNRPTWHPLRTFCPKRKRHWKLSGKSSQQENGCSSIPVGPGPTHRKTAEATPSGGHLRRDPETQRPHRKAGGMGGKACPVPDYRYSSPIHP